MLGTQRALNQDPFGDRGAGLVLPLRPPSRPRCPARAHSPSEQGLLQTLAGGEGLPSEHVAHHYVQAAGHEGQHSLRLQGAAAGDEAQALQGGALAQCLEELGVGAEVGLLQPAERGRRESRGRPARVGALWAGGTSWSGAPKPSGDPALPSKQAG